MNPESIINAYENGERELEPLLEKMGWTSWLGAAELGLVMNSDIVEYLEDKLTPAETMVLDLVKQRIDGGVKLESKFWTHTVINGNYIKFSLIS